MVPKTAEFNDAEVISGLLSVLSGSSQDLLTMSPVKVRSVKMLDSIANTCNDSLLVGDGLLEGTSGHFEED